MPFPFAFIFKMGANQTKWMKALHSFYKTLYLVYDRKINTIYCMPLKLKKRAFLGVSPFGR